MSVPKTPSFIQTAKMLNELVPELSKNIRPLKPLLKGAKANKSLADGLTQVGKRANYVEQLARLDGGKAGNFIQTKLTPIQKITDALKRGAFKEINPSWGARFSSFLNILNAGFSTFMVLKNDEIQALNIESETVQASAAQSAFTRSINNSIQIRNDRKVIEALRLSDQRTRDRVYGVEKEQIKQRQSVNDTLYEVRQGRRILENQIADARKLGNDALYEVRQTVSKVNAQIQTQTTSFNQQIARINQQIGSFTSGVNSNFQSTVNSAIARLQGDVNAVKNQVAGIRQPQPVDTNAIINSAKNAATQEVSGLRNQVTGLQTALSGVLANVGGIERTIPVLAGNISNVGNAASQAQNTANKALAEAKIKNIFDTSALQRDLDNKFNAFTQQNAKDLKIKDLQISDLSKQFDKQFSDFQRQSNLTSDQRFKEFINSNNEALKIRDLTTSNLSKEFDARLRQFETTTNTKFKEVDKVNAEGNKDLKDILTKINGIIPTIAGIPLIAGNAANLIRPSIPTLPQIEAATGTAMCRNLQTGCGKKAIDDAVGNVNQHNTNNTSSLLDAVNTGANAALIQGQQTILARLGDQLPGGIGGKLTRFTEWLQLDRALNLLTFAATVHNAFQLSNDIAVTLGSALSNVLQLIGIKNDDGSALDIGQIINSTVENFVKGIVGADNYQQMSQTFAKANRIYQATTNILNAFQGLASAILTGLEMTAGKVAKIGNALRKSGEVLESAYGWMNPQPKFNRITQTLENLQNGASTIQMVTQAPLDIINATTELTTATTELTTAIKEDGTPTNKGKESPEPDQLKAVESTAKLASIGLEMIDLDLDADE